jgi:ATP phosphoribosyltransferase regulatory subunit
VNQPKGFEKPVGLKDYMPDAVAKLRAIQHEALTCMQAWGYREVMTPTLEYYDTVGVASATQDHKLFKLLDRKGQTLVLRSEMTAPIARVVASMMREESLPIRLSYHAHVFRAQAEEAGRDAEFYQTGVELIGEPSADGDAEVIALAVATLKAVGVQQFRLAIGHIGFLNGVLSAALPGKTEEQDALKTLLLQRNLVGYRDRIRTMQLDSAERQRLLDITRLRGGVDVCDQAAAFATDDTARAALAHLRLVWDALADYGVTESVMIDLTMIGDFSYYTGVIFEGYAEALGFPLCSGGRYDQLLTQFDRPAPATGFAIKANRILELRNGEPANVASSVVIAYASAARSVALRAASEQRANAGSAPVGAVVTHPLTATELALGEAALVENLATRYRIPAKNVRVFREVTAQ